MTDKIIGELENKLTQAERECDRMALQSLLSDEYSGVSVRGHVLDKAGFLTAFSGTITFNSLEIEDLMIRHFNGFSTVVGRSVFEIKIPGHESPYCGSGRYLDVWVPEGTDWKLISSSVTPENME